MNEKVEHGRFKRVPGSGAIGTIMKEPLLVSDIKGTVDGIENPFILEAKIGYGGSKQFTIKKSWLDKIENEARSRYGIPAIVCRFSGSRNGVENFVVMDLDVFAFLLNKISELQEIVDGKEKDGEC